MIVYKLLDLEGNLRSFNGKTYEIKGYHVAYDRNGNLKGFIVNANNKKEIDAVTQIVNNLEQVNFPRTLKEYLRLCPESRHTKITYYKSKRKGNSKGAKITIPVKWLKMMNLDEDNRNVEIKFNGEEIIIKKK